MLAEGLDDDRRLFRAGLELADVVFGELIQNMLRKHDRMVAEYKCQKRFADSMRRDPGQQHIRIQNDPQETARKMSSSVR